MSEPLPTANASQFSIHNQAIQLLLAGYEHKGFDITALIQEINQPKDFFQRQAQRLPSLKLADIIRLATRQLNDETLGFLKRKTKLGSMDLALSAAMGAKTLRGAIARLAHFFELVHDDMRFELEESGKQATLKVVLSPEKGAPLDTKPVLFVIIILLFSVRWMSWLVNRQIMLNRITLQMQEPVFASDMESVFPCAYAFSKDVNGIQFSQDFLSLPLERKLKDVPQFIATLPNLLTRRFIDSNLTGQIKRMLKDKNNIASLPLKTIADELNKSPQTIRRHLKQEGITFLEIKENVRRDIASDLLIQHDVPIKNIAYRVGFSEPSAFIRAFKNWTGLTPGEYRENHRLAGITQI